MKFLKIRTLVPLFVVAIAGVILVVDGSNGPDQAESAKPGTAATPEDELFVTSGYEVELEPGRLAEFASRIVVATPTAVVERAYSETPGIPEEAQKEAGDIYRFGRYRDYTLEVDDYLLGSGNDELTVRTAAPPDKEADVVIEFEGGIQSLDIGVQRVFFLSEGTGINDGTVLPLGRQGIGTIEADGESVVLGYGQRTSLAELQELSHQG